MSINQKKKLATYFELMTKVYFPRKNIFSAFSPKFNLKIILKAPQGRKAELCLSCNEDNYNEAVTLSAAVLRRKLKEKGYSCRLINYFMHRGFTRGFCFLGKTNTTDDEIKLRLGKVFAFLFIYVDLRRREA